MDTAQSTQWIEGLRQGGPLLALIGGASVVALAVAMAKGWTLIGARGAVRRLDEKVVEAVRRGDWEEARRLAEGLPEAIRPLFVSGLDRALGRARGQVDLAMARELRRASARLKRGLWILGSIGALMPFLGLLGTVTGIMASFEAIGQSGQGGFAVVSAGIAEALVATAAGLGVAIEAVLFYNVLQSAFSSVVRELGLLVEETVEAAKVKADGDK